MGQRKDRIWLLGGIVAVVVLVAAGWFLLIRPKYQAAAQTRDDTANLQVQLVKLKRTVATRKAQAKQITALTAKLNSYKAALPATTGIPDFLKQLQVSGTTDSVAISGISVASPSQVTTQSGVWELAIAMNASGTAANLCKFLDRLQNVQARAVLISSVSLSNSTGDSWTASLSMKAFVAPTSTTSLTTN